MNRRAALVWSIGLSAALSAVTPAGGQDAPKSRHAGTAVGFQRLIADLRAANDVRGLQQLAEEIGAEWRATNDPAYYPVILEVCLAMNSTRTTEPGVDASVRALALAALDAPGEKPAPVSTKLLLFLHGDLDYSTGKLAGEKWAAERRARAERWLRVWRSVRDQNAALPVPIELPLMRVEPPDGLPIGVGPDAVKDPVRRKQFEEAIELNRRRAEAYRTKRDFEQLEEDIEADAARYLTEAYSRPPFRTRELETLLAGHGSTKDRRAIVAEVRRREEAEAERAAAVAKSLAAVRPGAAGKKLQYSVDGSPFRDVPLPLYVEADTPVTFRAPFAGETCVWNGSAGVTGRGDVTKGKLTRLSKHAADFQTVTATGNGGTATAHVVVFELHPVYTPKDDFPGRSYDAYGVYEFINLSYKTVPPGIRDVDLGGLRWVTHKGGGDLYGGGGGVGTYQVGGAGGSFVLSLQYGEQLRSERGP